MSSLTFGSILQAAGIDAAEVLVIRHAYVREHEDSGMAGLSGSSDDAEILEYTKHQSTDPRKFPASPPRLWVVFIREGGDRARLWSVLENHGETSNDGQVRTFDLVESENMADLRSRLVIGWRSPRTWRIRGVTAADYPVMEIADAEPAPFPGFDQLILDYGELQAVMREQRYASWRVVLASVAGVYVVTDMRDGRHYIGKADGAESIRQRWHAYATSGHGGNVELRNRDPKSFRFSLLRVFDPATPGSVIDRAESHFKDALGTRSHGMNRN